MPFIETLGQGLATQAASGGVSGLLGIALQRHNDKRQIKQQQALTDQQTRANMQMTDYQRQSQMQMWNDTNYSAQKEHMKKAGLNPALLYGMSGGGGATVGGGAASVNAPSAPQGGGEVQGLMGLGLQGAMLQAQIDNIKADTKLKETDAEKTGGVDTIKTGAEVNQINTNIEKLKQETNNLKAQEILTKIQTRGNQIDTWIKEDTYDETVGNIVANYERNKVELSRAKMDRDIQSTTYQDAIKIIQQQAIAGVVQNELTRAQTATQGSTQKLQDAQIKKIGYDIAIAAGELAVKEGHLNIESLKAKVTSMNISPLNVAGGILNKIVDRIAEIYKNF